MCVYRYVCSCEHAVPLGDVLNSVCRPSPLVCGLGLGGSVLLWVALNLNFGLTVPSPHGDTVSQTTVDSANVRRGDGKRINDKIRLDGKLLTISFLRATLFFF